MPSLASTATPTIDIDIRVYAALLLALAIVTGCYLLGCWLWPFGACRKCHGTGKRRSPFGRAFRLCRRCHGDGRRLRIGRHVLNHFRALHDKGTR